MGTSQPSLSDRFRDLANAVTHAVGTPLAMAVAALLIVAWAVTGPFFGFSDTPDRLITEEDRTEEEVEKDERELKKVRGGGG
jgi:hypothetical protein